MRIHLLLAFASNLLMAAVSLAILPGRVAIHFALGGLPNGWAPAWLNALLFAGMAAILLPLFLLSARLVFAFPDRWINLPNKAHWLVPGRRLAAAALIARHLEAFGAALYLFLLAVQALVIRANLDEPIRLNETLFLSALGLFIGFNAVWVVRFYRSFRVPKDATGSAIPVDRERMP